MPQVQKREAIYKCCQCNTLQRWEISRCDTILSDGFPCNHARREQHCKIFAVRPNRDDRFLPRDLSRYWCDPTKYVENARSASSRPSSPSLSKQNAAASCPVSRAKPANEADTGLQQQVARCIPYTCFPNETTDLNVDAGRPLSPGGIESGKEVQNPGSDVTARSLQHEQQSTQSQLSITQHAISSDAASTSNGTVEESEGERRLSNLESSSPHSGTSRTTKKARGGSIPRPKFGTRLYNSFSGIWSLACPYDKFLPSHSDCVHFACQTEKDLHRRHMQSHVEQQDIPSEEYTRLTRARNFKPLENNTITAKEQDWRHWQKQFVAIYPIFREVESLLNPEKYQPLLQDASLFEELRRRQNRCFEDVGSPLPYAYLPRRVELADLNTRWTVSSRSRHADRDTAFLHRASDTAAREFQSIGQGNSVSYRSFDLPADVNLHPGIDILPGCAWSESSPFEDLNELGGGFTPPPPIAVEEGDVDATPSSNSATDAASVFSLDLEPVSTPGTERETTPPALAPPTSGSDGDATPNAHTRKYNTVPCDLVGYQNEQPIEEVWPQGEESEVAQFMTVKRNEARLAALHASGHMDTDPGGFAFIDPDVD